MNILFIGDIVGRPGREYILSHLGQIRNEVKADICIANGENVSHGNSITEAHVRELWGAGIDVFTMGNHTFNRNMTNIFDSFQNIVRPANYSKTLPGEGSLVFDAGRYRVGVVNVQGQVFLDPIDSPFTAVIREIEKIKEESDVILVDFHAEATSEKGAMGYFLDGKVTAVVGTHTHVQTADERILPNGTAFISDVGMTGVRESVLGTKKEIIVNRFAYQQKDRFELAEGEVQFNAVLISADPETGKAIEIKRIQK